MEADVTARPLVGHEFWQRRQLAAGSLIGRNDAILAQPAQDIGEPLLRPAGMPVGIEEIRPLGQAGEQRALLEGELLRRLAKIAARRELDAPGAAAEIDRVEIELEDFRLAQRLLEPRGHDHLADLALVAEILA